MIYYERVKLKITEFDVEDVITTSDVSPESPTDPTDPPYVDPYELFPGV